MLSDKGILREKVSRDEKFLGFLIGNCFGDSRADCLLRRDAHSPPPRRLCADGLTKARVVHITHFEPGQPRAHRHVLVAVQLQPFPVQMEEGGQRMGQHVATAELKMKAKCH